MRKLQRKFDRPTRTWDKSRIEEEKAVMKSYGLRRKKELWRAESILREYRRLARELSAEKNHEKEKVLLDKLFKMGLVPKDANLDQVLALTIQNILDRRLQTVVYKKGLAKTSREARQYIVHGHISFDGRKAKWPSTLVHLGGEEKVNFHEKSSIGVKK